jgi:hypothetical protein
MRSDEMANIWRGLSTSMGAATATGTSDRVKLDPAVSGGTLACVFDTTGPAARHHRVPAVLGFQPT